MHDFAWGPKGDSFLVIGGRSPPLATLHKPATGAAVFSFGTGGWNTVQYAPHGRFVLLAGFGGMSGDMAVWDVLKQRQLSVPGWKSNCVVACGWAPDSRHLLVSTTRPRMQVDNQVKVWGYKGELLLHQPMPVLLEGAWRPEGRQGVYLDRAASPGPAAAGAGAAAAAGGAGVGAGVGAGAGPEAAASKPAAVGVFRPRNATSSVVAEMMRAGQQAAGRIGPAAGAGGGGGGGAGGGSKGAAGGAGGQQKQPQQQQAGGQQRREGAGSAGVAAGAGAAACGGGGGGEDGPKDKDPVKEWKRLQTKIKEAEKIAEAVGRGEAVNPDQLSKMKNLEAFRARAAELDKIVNGF